MSRGIGGAFKGGPSGAGQVLRRLEEVRTQGEEEEYGWLRRTGGGMKDGRYFGRSRRDKESRMTVHD